MSNFDSVLAADAANVFAGGEFGESIIYKPRVGAARTISAVVIRKPSAQRGSRVVPIVELLVANSTTLGIGSAELNIGGDKVTLAVRKGDAAVDLLLHLPEDGQPHEDPGMIRLEAF